MLNELVAKAYIVILPTNSGDTDYQVKVSVTARKGAEAGVHLIPDRVDIDERPDIVDDNSELGQWAGGTV